MMKLAATIKLKPTPEQAAALRAALERCNAACDALSAVAWQAQAFRQFALHKLAYRHVRERFGLSAQATVRCIGKVADAYERHCNTQRTFRASAAQPYDARIFRFVDDGTISL